MDNFSLLLQYTHVSALYDILPRWNILKPQFCTCVGYISRVVDPLTESLDKNMVMSPAGPTTKKESAGEDQQQFTWPIDIRIFLVPWCTEIVN
jgi:hypothetical protein